jgi:hypothetical protein
MLIELKDVEVFIEPEVVLTQALEEGDITTATIVAECISEDGVDSVLKTLDADEIIEYVQKYNLKAYIGGINEIIEAISLLNDTEKAQVLWHLLKCKEQ